jgi:L-histidine N-alpha-methyltransferase
MRQPRVIQLHREDAVDTRAGLTTGLSAPAASIAPKWFYDALGSRLFDAITELPEYYPTRTEATIMAASQDQIAESVGRFRTLIDVGAGNCAKAGRLFVTLQPHRYVALDISVEFLRHAIACLQREHPTVDMLGVGIDFSQSLVLPPEAGDGPRTLFYPGSSIGNFAPDAALAFLRRARQGSPGGHLLIGVDLVKDVDTLHAAYNDPLGVTAAFNLNVLPHVNRVLGSDFDPRQWRHVAFYDEPASRIEMHLEARERLVVRWPDGERIFAAGERIHTENSYKYTTASFETLLRAAGWVHTRCFTDERRWFAVFCAV